MKLIILVLAFFCLLGNVLSIERPFQGNHFAWYSKDDEIPVRRFKRIDRPPPFCAMYFRLCHESEACVRHCYHELRNMQEECSRQHLKEFTACAMKYP